MALQGPFFGKREADPAPARYPHSTSSTQPHQPPAAQTAAAAASAAPAEPAANRKPGGSQLTVGPNIKLKGVEITDCDTLVVDGMVEATMDSRVIQISEQGAFKGSAEIDLAEIRGSFDGNLTVRDKLVIFATGRVSGKIRYGKVVIEEGGQLSGDISAAANAGGTRPAPVLPG